MNLRGFLKAEEEARNSGHKKYFVGAVVLKGNRIISIGRNDFKTHPKAKGRTYSECLHAEMKAVINARSIPKWSELYVYRARKCGTPGLSKPCPACLAIIKKTNISKIFFTNPDSSTGYSEIRL